MNIGAGDVAVTVGALSGTNPQSEQTLELSPGVRVVVNRPRVKGFLDYSLSGLYYAQKTSGDNLRHALNANARIDAWDNRAFVDLSGVVSDITQRKQAEAEAAQAVEEKAAVAAAKQRIRSANMLARAARAGGPRRRPPLCCHQGRPPPAQAGGRRL